MSFRMAWGALVKFALPVLAAALLAFAWYSVWRGDKSPVEQGPVAPPPTSPFRHTVAGAGMVEASSENIKIGSHSAGIVDEVFVKEGQQDVAKGAPLFSLDTRALRAQLAVREAELASAKAEMNKAQSEPRPESLPPLMAAMRETDANLESAKDKRDRSQKAYREGAITANEMVNAEQAFLAAQAAAAQAKAQYELQKAGTWKYDLEIARAKVQSAQAAVDDVHVQIDLRTMRAPIEGEILRVDVRPGEFVGAPPGATLIVMGATNVLHIRVDIDEYDIPHFRTDSPAVARVRGAAQTEIPLQFVRVSPYVIPKTELTGRNSERVDTRVLQVIYAVKGQDHPPLYVGQQVDVYINVGENAKPEPTATGGSGE